MFCRGVEHRSVNEASLVVHFHAVSGLWLLALSLYYHLILQSAFGGCHAFFLGVLGKELFACTSVLAVELFRLGFLRLAHQVFEKQRGILYIIIGGIALQCIYESSKGKLFHK